MPSIEHQGKYRKTCMSGESGDPRQGWIRGHVHNSKGMFHNGCFQIPVSLPVLLPAALPQINERRVLALSLQHFLQYLFPQMLGPLPKLPRTWSDVVRDIAREPNTLRMAALMKELTEVDPKMFANASRERRRRQNEWTCTGIRLPVTIDHRRRQTPQNGSGVTDT